MKTKIIFVGGFLGSGKTTLLFNSAKILMDQGYRVGLITNDQADELVDTAFLETKNNAVEEVSGSCFCCNFNGLVDAISHLIDTKEANIILAEPVGSCTDLSATLIQPLKDKYKTDFEIAPLSALADPQRLKEIVEGNDSDLHSSAAYIYRKQLEEADFILINKTDTLNNDEKEVLLRETKSFFKNENVHLTSGLTGEGVNEWLELSLKTEYSGNRIVEVDYDIYAEGEAVLGWVNSSYLIEGELPNPELLLKNMLEQLVRDFKREKAAVGHVKLFLVNSDGQFIMANIVKNNDKVSIRGKIDEFDSGKLTINARVEMDPDKLLEKTQKSLEILKAENSNISEIKTNHLKPGRPEPTFRYDKVVEN